jgi:hypothetical protein
MPQLNYSVGQVLFVLPKGKTNVVPIQIVEEITKKTLQGELVSYIVRAGVDENNLVDINEVDGEIFDSSEVVKTVLVERSTEALLRLVDNAIAKSKEWYVNPFEASAEDPVATITKKPRRKSKKEPAPPMAASKSTVAKVTLPDGSQVPVDLPPIEPPPK